MILHSSRADCDNGDFSSLPHSNIMASQKVFPWLSLLYIMKFVVGEYYSNNRPKYWLQIWWLLTMVTLARPPIPGPLWKSLIALFSMLRLVYGTNSPLIFASLVRHSLLHFHPSHMAVHHHLLRHLHDHHLHLLLLVQSFTLNLRRGSSANHFLHRPFPLLPDWFHGLSDHLMFLFCSTAGCLHGVLY